MARWVKVLTAKLDDLSLIPGIHRKGAECCPVTLQVHHGMFVCTHINKCNKNKFKNKNKQAGCVGKKKENKSEQSISFSLSLLRSDGCHVTSRLLALPSGPSHVMASVSPHCVCVS